LGAALAGSCVSRSLGATQIGVRQRWRRIFAQAASIFSLHFRIATIL
jgi:hypothetical protein